MYFCILLLYKQSLKAHQVMQFHITCWQPDGQCSSLRSVVDTIEEVVKVQRKTGNKPIFVHCRYHLSIYSCNLVFLSFFNVFAIWINLLLINAVINIFMEMLKFVVF